MNNKIRRGCIVDIKSMKVVDFSWTLFWAIFWTIVGSFVGHLLG